MQYFSTLAFFRTSSFFVPRCFAQCMHWNFFSWLLSLVFRESSWAWVKNARYDWKMESFAWFLKWKLKFHGGILKIVREMETCIQISIILTFFLFFFQNEKQKPNQLHVFTLWLFRNSKKIIRFHNKYLKKKNIVEQRNDIDNNSVQEGREMCSHFNRLNKYLTHNNIYLISIIIINSWGRQYWTSGRFI